jgi:hypothetical protein
VYQVPAFNLFLIDLLVEALDAFDEPHLLSTLTAKKSKGKSTLSLTQGLAHNLRYNWFRK